MSTHLHMMGEYHNIRIGSDDDDDGTIWLETGGESVSLTLTAKQRDALRAALDNAEMYAKGDCAREVTP